ncbi:MAG: hypothetical protein R3Y10_09530 [Ferrimonas sp.]
MEAEQKWAAQCLFKVDKYNTLTASFNAPIHFERIDLMITVTVFWA